MNRTCALLARTLSALALVLFPSVLGAADGRIPIKMPDPAGTILIESPGSYYLAGDVTYNGGDVIEITATPVILDLNGFTVRCEGPTGYAISASLTTAADIRITNGKVTGGQRGVSLWAPAGEFQIDHLSVSGQGGSSPAPISVSFDTAATVPGQAVIEENQVAGAGFDYGIFVRYVSGGCIARNAVDGCGILLNTCSNNTVSDNTVAGAPAHGIGVATFSNGNRLARNTVSGCTLTGISLTDSDYNSLTWNLAATNSACGIGLGSGTDRNVYAYNRTPNNTAGGICDSGTGNVNGGGNIYP